MSVAAAPACITSYRTEQHHNFSSSSGTGQPFQRTWGPIASQSLASAQSHWSLSCTAVYYYGYVFSASPNFCLRSLLFSFSGPSSHHCEQTTYSTAWLTHPPGAPVDGRPGSPNTAAGTITSGQSRRRVPNAPVCKPSHALWHPPSLVGERDARARHIQMQEHSGARFDLPAETRSPFRCPLLSRLSKAAPSLPPSAPPASPQ